jgi:HlyD family type I secretion membrane fusion protein
MIKISKISKLYDFIPNVQTKDFLPSPNKWFIASSTLLVGVFLASIAAAATMKYDDAINAVATVRASGELSIVQSNSEGVIQSILVKEDAVVKKGDPIAVISNPKYDTQKNQTIGNIQKLTDQIREIDAQIRSLSNQFIAQADRNDRTLASARVELQRRKQDHQSKIISVQSDLEEAEANLQIANRNLEQGRIELGSLQSALEAAQIKRTRYEALINSGAIERDKVDEVILIAKQQAQAVEKQKQEVQQRQQVVQAAEARIRRAKSNLNPSNADSSIATESIAQEQASGKIALAQLDKERQSLSQQRIELQQQIENNNQQLSEIEHQLSQKVIYSPIDGVVLKLNVRNPKQPVTIGTEIAQITPSRSQLVIKAAISAQDIGKVKSDQQAILQISAYPYPDYGTLKGKVISVAPDSTEATNINPTSDPKAAQGKTYQVTILPENSYLTKNNRQYLLKPGMESKVQIVTAEETILSFVLRKIRLGADI